jgi:lactoylglutathione lyase
MKMKYTVLHVHDIQRSVEFYRKAFGIKNRFIHESGQYAEMETGDSTLAFASDDLASSIIKDGYRRNLPGEKPSGIQIAFEPDDVEKAFENALKAGATAVSLPELKPWGWISAFVRDPDGILVELAKEVT